MSRPPFDESHSLPIAGERRDVLPLLGGVAAGFLILSIVVLVLVGGTEAFGTLLPILIVVNILSFAVVGWQALKRRNYLRDRMYGRVIDRTPGRPDGQGLHEGPNLAE